MLQMHCLHCGPRNVQEFVHAGEMVAQPSAADASLESWRAFLYLRQNPAGWVRERWYHQLGCARFIEVERNTVTNVVRSVRPPAAQRRRDAGREMAP